MRLGTESGWVGHAIQNVATHGVLAKQRMFQMQSGNWNGYFQYKSKNPFSSW